MFQLFCYSCLQLLFKLYILMYFLTLNVHYILITSHLLFDFKSYSTFMRLL